MNRREFIKAGMTVVVGVNVLPENTHRLSSYSWNTRIINGNPPMYSLAELRTFLDLFNQQIADVFRIGTGGILFSPDKPPEIISRKDIYSLTKQA